MAGEIDEAEDLFTDVAEEGLELVAPEAAAIALGERAAIAIGRGAWDPAEELVDRGARIVRRSRMDEYPTNVRLRGRGPRCAPPRRDRGREALAQAQRLRPRLTYALPYFAIQTRWSSRGPTSRRRCRRRRDDAPGDRRDPAPAAGPRHAPSQAEELRANLKTMRADAPGPRP